MKKPISTPFASLFCAVVLAACGGDGTPDVPAPRDVPTGRDVALFIDVMSPPSDSPLADAPDFDVPTVDVPNVPDVPNAVEDTGVCAMGRVACAGSGCVDTQTDPANCGLCGVDCGLGRLCSGGMCTCAMGTTMCGGACVNLLNDTSNCGACGRACGANQMCIAGACQLDCPMPNSICVAGGIMSCVNLQSDPNNCGACNTACRAVNAASTCTNRVCGLGACNAGFGNCDNNAANGCEVNTTNNIAHCGGCGMACPVRANSSPTCAAGVCGLTCNAGFANCDANAVNGCESNTQSDAQNCGGCGVRCAAGQSCSLGVCRAAAGCIGNAQWTPVTCTTGEWVWSMDRARATTLAAANAARVLTSSNTGPAPGGAQGMCSLDGTGYVSTRTFIMANCNANWYHIGGRYTGNCGGHDGELYRLLALGPNDCYAY